MSAQFRALVTRLLVAAVLNFAASGTATAAIIQLRAWLNGAQEVPPAVTGATGLAKVTYDTVTGLLNWNVTYGGLSSNINGAHFHGPTSAGFNADIKVPMPYGPSPIVGSATIDAMQAAQLLSGQWYIDLHSDNFAGGEIRGQVLVVRGDFDGDGRADILWRNSATGENYVYPMNGTQILDTEGYARTVSDQNWQIVGIGDFDGDGQADILWRNSASGENYIYLMNGKDIAGEGYIRTVEDQNWKVAGVGDLDGDGKADIVWRNAITGENYVYFMNALAIQPNEGYLRTVADLTWGIAGIGDFDGDGKSDILWRNAITGQNYLYPMDGTTIKPNEGYLRTVADLNWTVVSIGDFDGDGKSDILWRNISTGENYLYPMDGHTILGTEGYLRTVADRLWKVQATGDYDGDGKADILWRNSVTGENYIYLMNGSDISGEGNLRQVADQNWNVAGRPQLPKYGLEFPNNGQVRLGDTVRFKFRRPDTNGLPIYGPGGNGVTYIFKVLPKHQSGYYTTFFWANDDGRGIQDTFFWKNGQTSDTYYGAHPYPDSADSAGTTHRWEISVDQGDFVNGAVDYGRWHTQALRVWRDASGFKHHEFYWDLPLTDGNHVVSHVARSPDYGETNPPEPALTFGDAPWNPGSELCSCILRGIQIYSSLLSLDDIRKEIASPLSTPAGSASVWYLNTNPTPTDISDKSGRGNHPAWVGPLRPSLWSQ